VLDGVLHKISEPVSGSTTRRAVASVAGARGRLDAVFTPFYDKKSATNLGVVSSRTDQCFGTWSGRSPGTAA
jgi:hypothetical protein